MSKLIPFSIVYAVGPNGEFGNKGGLPWSRIKEDMKFFRDITTTTESVHNTRKNAVIMGRKTFESIGKPLSNRINIIVSRTITKHACDDSNVYIATSLIDALSIGYRLRDQGVVYNAFVIGGVELLKESLTASLPIEYVYCTYVIRVCDIDKEEKDAAFIADTYFKPKSIGSLISDTSITSVDGIHRITFIKCVPSICDESHHIEKKINTMTCVDLY